MPVRFSLAFLSNLDSQTSFLWPVLQEVTTRLMVLQLPDQFTAADLFSWLQLSILRLGMPKYCYFCFEFTLFL